MKHTGPDTRSALVHWHRRLSSWPAPPYGPWRRSRPKNSFPKAGNPSSKRARKTMENLWGTEALWNLFARYQAVVAMSIDRLWRTIAADGFSRPDRVFVPGPTQEHTAH
ncbi:hypothetical protein HGRIS_006690 [Hohenbuehelia grisea]|uniref:Transposase n=1 Tax=Hohenbuehelia grisea TaxID=104357 RepID=A0ABR3JA46_9AGAR